MRKFAFAVLLIAALPAAATAQATREAAEAALDDIEPMADEAEDAGDAAVLERTAAQNNGINNQQLYDLGQGQVTSAVITRVSAMDAETAAIAHFNTGEWQLCINDAEMAESLHRAERDMYCNAYGFFWMSWQ